MESCIAIPHFNILTLRRDFRDERDRGLSVFPRGGAQQHLRERLSRAQPLGALGTVATTLGAFGASAGAAFAPTDIAGLLQWLDSSDPSTLFQDSALTVPSIGDGNVIGGIKDKSGLGYHATQGTDSFKPLLKLGIQNNKSVVRFDGTNDYLASLAVPLSGTCTVFVVAKMLSGSHGRVLSCDKYINWLLGWHSGVCDRVYFSNWVLADSTPITASPILYSSTYNDLDKDTWVYKNSALLAHNNLGRSGPVHITLGAYQSSNSPFQWAEFSNCDVCEVILYDAILSNFDRANVEGYLNARWAIY